VTELGQWLPRAHTPGNDGREEPIPEWLWVDPSAASFQQELLEQRIGRVAPADNRVLPGIQLMSSMLSTDRLKVTTRCPGFIEEAPGYSWDTDQAAKGKDAVIKAADHSIDGARYSLLSSAHSWRSSVRAA
jgi:hypothetical protein